MIVKDSDWALSRVLLKNFASPPCFSIVKKAGRNVPLLFSFLLYHRRKKEKEAISHVTTGVLAFFLHFPPSIMGEMSVCGERKKIKRKLTDCVPF